MKRMFVKMGFSLVAAVALQAVGDTVNFLATKDNDLANPENWSVPTWTSADTLLVSADNFTLPADGLRVSSDLPASAELTFGTMPARNVPVDFGGHSLNTTTLCIGKMHSDADRNFYLQAKGGFTGVVNLQDDKMKGHIRFYDGVYRIKNKLFMNNWFPYVHVCSGAQLIVEDANKDPAIWMHGDTSYGQFVLDGGRFSILNHSGSDYNWQRTMWVGNANNRCDVKFLNGSVYEDCSVYPSDLFGHAKLLIRDSGYYATNGIVNARNTAFVSDSAKEITNSVFRTAQLYCGPYAPFGKDQNTLSDYLHNATVDFCDSEVTLAFRPDSEAYLAERAGIAVPTGTRQNTIRIRGEKNRFTAQQFVLGGVSNTVEVSGGTFAVSNAFSILGSLEPRVSIANATAFVKSLSVSADATNSFFALLPGTRLTGDGDYGIAGLNGSMSVQAGAALDIGAHALRFSADNATFSAADASITGAVAFAANNGRVVISDGTHLKTKLGPEWKRVAPLSFAEGKANNVLVISNATYECGSYFMKDFVKTVEGPQNDGVPFTNCPNCRIEFQGDTPKFLVTDARSSESSGEAWYGLALGEMIDHAKNSWTAEHYLLKDPVRVRYVLPANGYAEPPLQGRATVLLLGGNAEFEFDASGYVWPLKTTRIPLVYNGFAFKGWNYRQYVNVDQLNKTNAARLPVNPNGHKARFELSTDGKTLNLVMPGTSGMSVLVR